jgi:hypothetical protein
MAINERIQKIVLSHGKNKEYLIKNKVGARQTVYDVWNGLQKPNYDFLIKFLTLFPDTDKDYLLGIKTVTSSGNQVNTYGDENKYGSISFGDMEVNEDKAGYAVELMKQKDREIDALKEVIKTKDELIEALKKK